MKPPPFALSTHLYHEQRLGRDQLVEIAAHGFEAIELFATRTHFDYHDAGAIDDLRGHLADTGLRVHSLHGPITESLHGDTWGPALSNATADEPARRHAVDETAAAIRAAAALGAGYLVVHLGVPSAQQPAAADNRPEAARRSLEELSALADAAGVRLALEVMPNALSEAEALVRLIEDELELPRVGICLDFAHAFLMGDVVDAVETVSGHLVTTHVHDNDGRRDTHDVPFDGRIDWASALMAVQKVGYEGPLLFELAGRGAPKQVLERAVRARARFEEMLGS